MDAGRLMDAMAAGFEIGPNRSDVVLFLHGWTGTPAQLRPVAEEVGGAGYGVVAPLHAGHGTDIADIVTVGWRDWVAGAGAAADAIVASGRRLHLAGLSMGGLIAILLAAVFDPTSLTTINAPYRVRRPTLYLSPLTRGSGRVRTEPDRAFAPGFATHHDIGYRGTPVGSGADLLDLIRAARRALPRISVPALVVQSRLDRTVRPSSGRRIHEGLASPTKRLLWLERSGHMATLDVERDVLAREMVRHLDASVGISERAEPHRGG